MTTTEPTPEAVEALARVVLPAMPNHCCPPGDLADCPWDAHDADGIARAVLAAGYVKHEPEPELLCWCGSATRESFEMDVCERDGNHLVRIEGETFPESGS